MTQFAHIRLNKNLGDKMCCPADYMPFGTPIDFQDYKGGDVVIGGGGFLHEGLQITLIQIAQASGIKKAIWGAGNNYHDATDAIYPDWLGSFDIVGLRDYGNPYEYVPCPSCLYSGFDQPQANSSGRGILVLEHYDHPIHIPQTFFKRATNDQPISAMPLLLDAIANSEYVITNTWHCLYWAMLLGVKAVCWKPFSNRFYTFKHPVVFCDEGNWEEQLSNATTYPGYLDECRTLNSKFAEKISKLFKQ